MFDEFIRHSRFLLDHAGWLVINLGVPVVLPFVAICLVAIDLQTGKLSQLLRKSIENGQLFWTVISLLAATAYDAIAALDYRPEMRESIWWVVGICAFMGFVSTMFVGIATMHAAHNQPVNGRTVVVSILTTVVMCFFYPFVHFKFQ
jgi:hypothetical protein